MRAGEMPKLRMTAALLLLGTFAWGCHSSRPDAQSAAMPSRLRIFPVEPDQKQRQGVVVLEWRGALEGFGESFAVIDETGYRGLVRTETRSKTDCDHCTGPLVDARLMSGAGPNAFGAVAVGPVGGALPHAKLERATDRERPGTEWRTSLRVDLDGDGTWDFRELERCGHYARSGCAGEACDMICSVVTKSNEAPDPREMDCHSFMPDLEDCPAG